MNNLIEDYKKNFNDEDDKINNTYIKYLSNIETLSLKEKNKIISCQNLLLEDKGRNASQYWNYLVELNGKKKITAEELK